MYESMEQMLSLEYGIQALSMHAVPSGWSAAAWRVHTGSGDYFLKVYDKNKPSTKGWVARIDSYMPVVLWLHGHTGLRGKMTAPLLAGDGAYKKEDASCLYMVFPFVSGQTVGGGKLSPSQTRELAEMVSELHAYGAGIPVATDCLQETFDVSFCAALTGFMENEHPSGPLYPALSPHADALTQAIAALYKAAEAMRGNRLPHVLCHTDIHGWNLMQGDSLVLLDWEGLKLAPAEADLFSFTPTFFFGEAWEDFMAAYSAARGGCRVNEDAMRFYRLRRRLEDIHAFAQSIHSDSLTREEMARPLSYLKRECGLLKGMF